MQTLHQQMPLSVWALPVIVLGVGMSSWYACLTRERRPGRPLMTQRWRYFWICAFEGFFGLYALILSYDGHGDVFVSLSSLGSGPLRTAYAYLVQICAAYLMASPFIAFCELVGVYLRPSEMALRRVASNKYVTTASMRRGELHTVYVHQYMTPEGPVKTTETVLS